MAQFAPPPPQFASAPGDGKPPLVPMKPMLPVGAEQAQQQQQQPIWASSSSKRDRQRQAAPADTHPPAHNGTGGADEPTAQADAPVAGPESHPNGSGSTQSHAEPVPQWSAEPQAAPTAQHSPHKRQREGPQDTAAAEYASEDAQAQQWDHDQAPYEQQPPEAAVSGEAAASARQRLEQLEHDVTPLVQQRAEVRHIQR